MIEYRCRAGHVLPVPQPADPGTTNCFECALVAASTGILPSEVVTGRNAIRRASGGGAIYAHACGGECLVWDVLHDGLLVLECDCGYPPTELADDLGIPHDMLHELDLRISAREMAYRTLAFNPTDRIALATLAMLGPGE